MNIKITLIPLWICLLSFFRIETQQSFDQFTDEFINGYKTLQIPPLELSYVNGLKHIKSASLIESQINFFESNKLLLKTYHIEDLNNSQKLDYELITYETNLNLERLTLEKKWKVQELKVIPNGGLYTVPNGKEWYAYFLKNWLSADIAPDEIYRLGLAEVKRVDQHIEDIRKETGLSENAFYKHLNDKEFYINNTQAVQDSFEHTKTIIYSNLNKIFNPHNIPPLKIENGTDQARALAPGYYDNNTFYYNQFNKPYNKRQIDWLFLHEGVPGHHYKLSITSEAKQSKVQQLFFYPGFEEGWAAYTEELGKDLGVYKTPYDELGKWEWDIVRSVRIPLDVGINYYGWTDSKALAFWKQHIKNQDDIAVREIARVKNWPAQAVTYKHGTWQIMQWKQALQKKQGNKFDIKTFHDRILNFGSLPIFMVEENVTKPY